MDAADDLRPDDLPEREQQPADQVTDQSAEQPAVEQSADGEQADDLQVAVALAREAGRRLVEHRADFLTRLGRDAQSGTGQTLTRDEVRALKDSADAMSHVYLTEQLAALRPDDAVLSEEGVDRAHRDDAERVWIVDPLDGTSEYGQQRSDWAVHVALWQRDASPAGGTLIAGVVELPGQHRTLTTGDAALDLPIPRHRAVRFVASRSRPPAMLGDVMTRLADRLAQDGLNTHGVELIQVGSVGAKVNEIIAGNAEVYLHDSGFFEWDLAAPLAVADHYGLYARHLDGSRFQLNQRPPFVRDSLFCIAALEAYLAEALER